MKIRLKICLVRDSAAAIQLEFYFNTKESVTTGELWDLFSPCIKPLPMDWEQGHFQTREVDTLIDVMTDEREEISSQDYVLEFKRKFFNPVSVYERVFEILAKDSRFDWEV